VVKDPCRLVRQVNQIGELAGNRRVVKDPCRLARQVNQIGELAGNRRVVGDPCRLVRQVNQIARLHAHRAGQSPSPAGRAGRGRAVKGLPLLAANLVHPPGKLAGVGCEVSGFHLAVNLLHPPDKLAGVGPTKL